MIDHVIRGPLLVPHASARVEFHPDAALACDARGRLEFVGDWSRLAPTLHPATPVRPSDGVMLPPLLDVHTHISQHRVRGRFTEGIPADDPAGQLLAGLQRNVFPAELRCDQPDHARDVVHGFLEDSLTHGVVGGLAYMTTSPTATEIALTHLPETWRVGLVLMNRNCPPDLVTDQAGLDENLDRLARRFGARLVITDRFAVAVDTPLRRRAASHAARHGLRTQTHLNEQIQEKQLVETVLHPQADSYTDVYRRDGLLDHRCVLAHCIHMRDDEWAILRDTGSAVAHCPTSNFLLGSGRMNLDALHAHGIPYALGTDVGASPTVSMLAEIARFLHVHRGRSDHATPSQALYRATRAAADLADLPQLGRLEPGQPMSFIEVAAPPIPADATADDVIWSLLPDDPDHPAPSVRRVTLAGRKR